MRSSRRTRHPSKRACDRCYRLKERCQRTSTSSSCERCKRLNFLCTIARPIKPAGRRASLGREACQPSTPQALGNSLPSDSTTAFSIQEYLETCSELRPDEKALLMSLLNEPKGLDFFVACPSLSDEQQQAFTAVLPDSLPLLKDAYLALAGALTQRQDITNTMVDIDSSLDYLAKGLETLRSLSTVQEPDAVLCNTLGSILSYSSYATIGVGAPEIMRYCLGTTGAVNAGLVGQTRKDPWRGFLISMDTLDSFVHQRKPACQFSDPSQGIDRHFGLCLSLLPHYHELSVISNSLAEMPKGSISPNLDSRLDQIHDAVESWQPPSDLSETLIKKHSAAEAVVLLAQAKAYRLGALLMVHRLRYPFGCGDEQAAIWSRELLMELEMATCVTRRPLQFVTLPFIVAAVEVRGSSQRNAVLRGTDDYVDRFAPAMRGATRSFLERVWKERDSGVILHWLDSVHKPCPVFESISKTVLNRAES